MHNCCFDTDVESSKSVLRWQANIIRLNPQPWKVIPQEVVSTCMEWIRKRGFFVALFFKQLDHLHVQIIYKHLTKAK